MFSSERHRIRGSAEEDGGPPSDSPQTIPCARVSRAGTYAGQGQCAETSGVSVALFVCYLVC